MRQGLQARGMHALAWLRALFACVLLAGAFAHAEVAVPPLHSRVTDLTGTLDAQQKATLEQTLSAFEQRKGSQIAVLLVPTTQPETIDDYAVRVEETWKLGRKGVDDGALLVIAKNDRKLRIEVGYGLEGALNDATAKRIVSDDIAPRFKQGDFYGGITAGVDRMIKVIDGEPLPPPKPKAQGATHGYDVDSLIVFGFLLVFVVGGILRAIFGRFVAAGIVATVAGAAAWIIGGAIVIAIVAAIIAFIISLLSGTSGHGGWGGGNWSSGSSGGGFSSSSDFSGGGGSSGGGGASGDW